LKQSKKLEPKLRVFAPVVVRGEEEKGVRLWEFGKEIYTQLLGIAEDEDYGDFTNIQEGFDFTVKAVNSETAGRKGLKCTISPRPKASPLSANATEAEKWLNEQPNILQIQKKYKFDELKEILQNFILGPEDADNEDEIGTVVSAPAPASAPQNDFTLKTKPKSKAASFDELFDDEEDENSPF